MTTSLTEVMDLKARLAALADPDHKVTISNAKRARGDWFKVSCSCGTFNRTEPTNPAALRVSIGHLNSLYRVAEQVAEACPTPAMPACVGCGQETVEQHDVSLSLTHAKIGSYLGTIHLCEACQDTLADHDPAFDFSKTHAQLARAATERAAFVAKVRLAMHRLAADEALYRLDQAIETERTARAKARRR